MIRWIQIFSERTGYYIGRKEEKKEEEYCPLSRRNAFKYWDHCIFIYCFLYGLPYVQLPDRCAYPGV